MHASTSASLEKVLEKIVREVRSDVQIIWLPVAHCELNAIELIWAYVKNKIVRVNLFYTA